MDEGKKDLARSYMLEYLDRVAPAWYPRRHVQFIVQKEYDGFDDMLKNRMLYAGIDVMAPVMTMRAGIDNKKGCSIAFVYDEKNGTPPSGFSHFLKQRGVLINQQNISAQYIYMPGDPIDSASEYLCDGLAIKCLIKETGDTLNEISIPIANGDAEYPLRLETLRESLELNISAWFGGNRKLWFETKKERPDSWDMKVFEKISSVSIDVSMDMEHQVFRWQEDSFRRECTACPPIDAAQALSIISNANITIPREMRLVGLAQAQPEESFPCYTMRYEHRLNDTTDSFNKDKRLFGNGFPDHYKNPGTIEVEGDFFVLYIDSNNNRVVGGHKKYRPVFLNAGTEELHVRTRMLD